jgi:SAM-dependent methyltransferase
VNENFYRDFEDRFRGSREDIRLRLEQYVQFLYPVLSIYPRGGIVDLGCGRGEWLELTQELGFTSCGVDLDEGMLSACKDKGLNAVRGQAIDYLSSLDDDSQVVVSAFHVVEHIPFNELRRWVSEALRVLKPGGLLIFETPNPENIAVANVYFYLDPTHLRPIPPSLLSFVLENSGFARVKTLRLQEPKNLAPSQALGFWNVVHSVSPDYSVIGQKQGPENLINSFDKVFESEFGVSLDMALQNSDSQISGIENKATEAQLAAQSSENKATEAQLAAQSSENKATEAQLAAQRAEELANQTSVTIEALLESRSWRITAPFRWASSQLRTLKSFFFR